MFISVKDLQAIATHAQSMAEAAQAMARAMQVIADDCAAQVAAKKQESTEVPEGFTEYHGPTPFDAPEENQKLEEKEEKGMTIAELRSFVASRTRPENRQKIKEILNWFGVRKLTELKEDQYLSVKKEVEKACPN